LDLVARRLVAQRIAVPAATPEEAVGRLGAVQAQDYLGALWAVGLRTKGASEATVEHALAERKIVRTWPMRGTLHFLAAADVRWMTALLAPRVVAGAASRLREFEIDAGVLRRARRAMVKSLEGGRRLTRPGAYEVLERAKIASAKQRGLHILWCLAHEGLLCFGPREGKQQTFVLLDEWLLPTAPRPRDEDLAELAHRYFTGHGPATIADFAWWSGLNLTEARLAVRHAEAKLGYEEIRGARYWFDPDDLSKARTSGAYALPAFDEILVGYADRSAALPPGFARRVIGGGIFSPSLVVGHRVVGTWRRRIERGRVHLSPIPFEPLAAPKLRAVERSFRAYAEFLGLPRR
jgi:hypothetical protein